MDGFEMGTIAGKPAASPHGRRIVPSSAPVTATRYGLWGVEFVDLDGGQQRIVISYDSEEVIHVTGPSGVTVDLLRQD